MLTFSLNSYSANDQYAIKVWRTIQSNKRYFMKMNPNGTWEEAMARSFIWAVEHKNEYYASGDILPYIKRLARTIMYTKNPEDPHSTMNESGSVSFVYSGLTETITPTTSGYSREIKDVFKDLYLMDKESFLSLKTLFQYDNFEGANKNKKPAIRNKEFSQEFHSLINNYGAEAVFSTLFSFYEELPEISSHRENLAVREIKLKKLKKDMSTAIPQTDTIVNATGKTFGIQSDLTMNTNPDYFKWSLLSSNSQSVVRLDISPYMDYIFEQVCVEEGVHTRHIEWCGDRCRMVFPDGTAYIGKDTDKFIEKARSILIFNLLADNVGKLVAVSADTLYFQPSRGLKAGKLRIKLATGKSMDLRLETHNTLKNVAVPV